MAEQFAAFSAWVQIKTGTVPYISLLSILPKDIFQYILIGTAAILLLLITLLLVGIGRGMKKGMRQRAIRKAFGVTDFKKFQTRRMGRPGSKYYTDNGSNCFEIVLPHWKFANADGSRQNRRVNKVIWEECRLWLHDGQKTYVLTTSDPYDMIYLVHTLRDRGVDVAPCAQELDKQDQLEKAKRDPEVVLGELLEKCEGEEDRFAEICRQRMTIRGMSLTDAPGNNNGIQFFFRKDSQPVTVRCQLVSRDYLVGIEEMKRVREGASALFAPSCMYITTGQVSVAAAGFALTNEINIVANDQLVEILEENKPVPSDKAYTRWELTNEDLKNLLSEDLLSRIF